MEYDINEFTEIWGRMQCYLGKKTIRTNRTHSKDIYDNVRKYKENLLNEK